MPDQTKEDLIPDAEFRATLEDAEYVHQFLKSPVGQKLTQRISDVIHKHIQILKVVDPKKDDIIQRAQNAIWRAEWLLFELNKFLNAADEVKSIIEHSDDSMEL